MMKNTLSQTGARQRRCRTHAIQRGAILIEILVAIVLFSIGVLGLIGLQVASMKNVGESQYRVEASLLTNTLIAQMRTADAATRQTTFASPSGTSYATWRDSVVAALPGASSTLPTVDTSNYPTVTVTVQWRAINDTGTRQYVMTTTMD